MELPYLTPGENLRLELELKTPAEIAAAFDVTVTTLAQWRSKEYGPHYVRVGKGIFYPLDELRGWLKRNAHSPSFHAELKNNPNKPV